MKLYRKLVENIHIFYFLYTLNTICSPTWTLLIKCCNKAGILRNSWQAPCTNNENYDKVIGLTAHHKVSKQSQKQLVVFAVVGISKLEFHFCKLPSKSQRNFLYFRLLHTVEADLTTLCYHQ